MRWSEVIYMLSIEITEDELANQIETPVAREVFANELEVGASEFYGAGANGLKPEKQFQIHAFEYKGETKLRHNGIEYKIIRAPKRGEWIRLTCERAIGNA